MNQYKYYLNSIEVFPINDSDLKYKYVRVNNGIILEKTLESNLTFNYLSGAFDFKAMESTNKCDDLPLVIKRLCSGAYNIWYEGLISIAEGEFNDDRCTFDVKPRQKKYTLNDVDVNILEAEGVPYYAGVYGIIGNVIGVRNYTNGRKFGNVLDYVAKKSNSNIVGIKSNLFQINPDGPFYLPGVINYYEYMVFFALSDIQEPIPSNGATKAIITFKKLMDDLSVMFDTEWVIDANNYLRVEHRIYFDGIVGIDLTQPQYEKYLVGTDKYTYDLDEFPKEEEWQIKGHSQLAKIKYGGLANVAKNQNSKSYSTTTIETDYVQIIQYTGGSSSPGIFLFATDGGPLGLYWSDLSGINEYSPLCPENLVRNFHTYKRPDLYGIFNSTHILFGKEKSGGIVLNSIRPIKKQTEISFPLCCDEELNLQDLIVTQMGNGYIDEATFETKKGILKTTLKFEVDNCNTFQPSELTGLQLWLKYNDVVKTGSAVSKWNDSSGNNRHAIQNTLANQPTHTGVNAPVYFQPSQFLVTPAFQLFPSKKGTVIVVGQSYSGEIAILSTNNGGAGTYWDLSVDNSGLSGWFVSFNQSIVLPQNNANPLLYSPYGLLTINRGDDTRERVTHNSVQNPRYLNPITIPNAQPSSEPLIIGDNPLIAGSTGSFRILELIIYDRSLSDLEIEKIEFYLVKKGIYTII